VDAYNVRFSGSFDLLLQLRLARRAGDLHRFQGGRLQGVQDPGRQSKVCCISAREMLVEAKMDFLHCHFRPVSAVDAVTRRCCEQSVQSRRGPVQCRPDWHPPVASMALWGSVQNYPACAVARSRYLSELSVGPQTSSPIHFVDNTLHGWVTFDKFQTIIDASLP
jgi:hypothetical protein